VSSPTRRAPRSDALRNRERVLAAAEQVFASRGLDATLDEVATAAGVGVGTVYRRFPSKADLLDAVFERRVDAGLDLLAECRQLPTAWAALREFLRRIVAMQSEDRGLHEFLYAADTGRAQFEQLRARIEPPLTDLIERAKAEGALRADFRATDVPPLTFMLTRLAHTDRTIGPALSRRYLQLILDGLRPGADRGAIEPAIDDDTLGDWLTILGGQTRGR
jgi:AcrR family transcriptional regulator